MKERPIIFSAPEVRAVLAGTKTQTRRVVRPQPPFMVPSVYRPFLDEPNNWQGYGDGLIHWYGACPYGVPGDRLWVRETHTAHDIGHVQYAADFTRDLKREREHGVRVTPSIHMPRWASRITLEIIDVRVQRLWEISEEDALAEGVFRRVGRTPIGDCVETDNGTQLIYAVRGQARDVFAGIWDSIHSKRAPWSSNPWVWALTFRRLP